MQKKQQSAWAEYKIEGKNIPNRSYACIGIHNNMLINKIKLQNI